MGRTTTIRLLAANATHQIAFGETNYVNSLILGTEKPVYMEEKDWSPKLLSLVQSDTSTGTLATITWPSIPDEFGPSEYEVSWNAVGDPIEVTGHLQTSKNIAVLTLWPDSLYLVTVDRYTSSGVIYGDTTQTLIINTKQSENPLLMQSTSLPCQNDGDRKFNMYLAIFASSAVSTSLFFLIILIRNGQLSRRSTKTHDYMVSLWFSSNLLVTLKK
ncbi:uncharacterized protein CEXT_447111 [Caerostris extrusa]|uniref:Fibronectin type-III domain-containing protein n=1 Tax=Caerostris extrusa TaxID=172846 RepID=A0AAV4Y636_CAEEX|nr:uncharacterized protein CEXT_447111 [Caerostris extrusa]